MPWNNQVVIFSALTKFWFPFSRDDYDKEVKQAKELQRRRHTTTPRRPRRPDMQVYHPRRRRKTDVLSLDFCADCAPISGKIMCVCVCAHCSDGSEPGAGADAEENESGSSTETDASGSELFWLEYEADSGTITSILVHKVNADFFLWCFQLFGHFLCVIPLNALCFWRKTSLRRW